MDKGMSKIRYEFHEQCPRHASIYPFHYHGLSAFNEKNEKIGYITTQSILKDTWEAFEKDPFLFACYNMSFFGIYEEDDDEKMLVEKGLNHERLLHCLEGKHLVNAEEYQGLTNEELKVFEPEWREALANSEPFKSRWNQIINIMGVNQPVISFIRVEDPYQNQGIAIEMYKQLALAFEKKGMDLYSSVTQTPAAEKCWSKMKQLGWVEEFDVPNRLPRLKINASRIDLGLENHKNPMPSILNPGIRNAHV